MPDVARCRIRLLVSIALLLAAPQPSCPSGGRAPDPRNQGAASGVELVRNPGFEEPGSPVPQGWVRDSRIEGKGTASQDRTQFHSGQASLKLQPNDRNSGKFLLAISQMIPATEYRGRTVEFSAFMSARGGARAGLGLMSIVRDGPTSPVFTQPGTGSEWVERKGTFAVPDDPSVRLVLFCVVEGRSGAAWFDDVSVRSPRETTAAADPDVPSDMAEESLKATVTVNAGSILREIPPTLFGANIEWRWNATGLWQEDRERVDPEVLRLTRDLGVTIIRYPGGIYSDFYHWRDGIGPRDERPVVKHRPDKPGESRPNFGTEEALAFAREVGAELLITVNAGTGTAQEAADWVRHVNAPELQVRYWEIGNELYIRSGSQVAGAVTVDPATYAARVREFAGAMKAADPRIKIGVIGGENQGSYQQMGYADWNKVVFERAGEYVDFLAVHNAYAPILTGDEKGKDPRAVYRAMLARPVDIARNLKSLSRQIEQYFPDRSPRPFIAVTEWGPIFQFFQAGRYVDHPKTLGSALFCASTLKAFVESPETEIAAFWMLNDFGALGWIASRNGDFPPAPEWAPTARYFAFQMFSRHVGDRVVDSSTSGPTFDTERVGWSDALNNVPYLDVVSFLSADGQRLHIMAINKHFEKPIEAAIRVRGFEAAPTGTAWLLTGTGIDANTGTTVIKVPNMKWGKQHEVPHHRRFNKGGPDEVILTSSTIGGLGKKFTRSFPEHSVTTLVLTRR